MYGLPKGYIGTPILEIEMEKNMRKETIRGRCC